MIVGDLNIEGLVVTIWPFKTHPPLLIDPNTVLPLSIATQRLKPVAWQPHQVVTIHSSFKQVKSPLCLISEGLEFLYVLTSGKAPCALVAISRRSLSASEFVHD
jgi:hypothetical protein